MPRWHFAASKWQQLKLMQFAVRSSGTWGLVAGILLVYVTLTNIGCGADVANVTGPRQLLYVGNLEPNTVSAYSISNDGSLAPLSSSPFPVGGNTVMADPNRKVLFSFGLNADTLQLNTDLIGRDGS